MHSLNNILYLFSFYYFFSNFIFFFFDERGDCGQAAEGDDLSRSGVPRGGFGE